MQKIDYTRESLTKKKIHFWQQKEPENKSLFCVEIVKYLFISKTIRFGKLRGKGMEKRFSS
jgi:hypothetical protein